MTNPRTDIAPVKTEIGRSQYPAVVAGFKSAACIKERHGTCASLKCGCVCHRLVAKMK